MTIHSAPAPVAGYGARPVAVDTVRRSRLGEAADTTDSFSGVRADRGRLSPGVVADRLALAHWPWGHQVLVSSLAGGVGRTTVCGLLATILAERPYAHLWPPIAIREAAQGPLSSTPMRWDLIPEDDSTAVCTRSGAWVFSGDQAPARREDFSAVILDSPAGLPSVQHSVADDRNCSVLLVVRPDRASLAETAEALVWLHDHEVLARRRVVVVVNHGAGTPDHGSRAAATSLWTRCSAVHRLPSHPALGPGRVLPSGQALPKRVRHVINHIALDLWASATSSHTASAVTGLTGEIL